MASTADLDRTFAALGDGTRRAIVKRLADGELGLSDLADPFPMTQTAVTKHVRVLHQAGLVDIEKRGRIRYCRLNPAGLQRASDWLVDYESFWTEQMDNLAHYFKGDDA